MLQAAGSMAIAQAEGTADARLSACGKSDRSLAAREAARAEKGSQIRRKNMIRTVVLIVHDGKHSSFGGRIQKFKNYRLLEENLKKRQLEKHDTRCLCAL